MRTSDKKLLALLRINARMPTSELARRLGLSRSTVQTRLKYLEAERIITGYTVHYDKDYEKRLIRAQVLIKVEQKLSGRVYVQLERISEISALYTNSGEYDLIALVTADSTAELSQLLDNLANLPGIERTNSSVILETKFSR